MHRESGCQDRWPVIESWIYYELTQTVHQKVTLQSRWPVIGGGLFGRFNHTANNECHYIAIGMFTLNKSEAESHLYLHARLTKRICKSSKNGLKLREIYFNHAVSHSHLPALLEECNKYIGALVDSEMINRIEQACIYTPPYSSVIHHVCFRLYASLLTARPVIHHGKGTGNLHWLVNCH